jgi:hypothetical protein
MLCFRTNRSPIIEVIRLGLTDRAEQSRAEHMFVHSYRRSKQCNTSMTDK